MTTAVAAIDPASRAFVAERTRRWSPVLVPSPESVGRYLWEIALDGSLWSTMAVMMKRLLAGYVLGLLAGVPLGFLTARVQALRDTLTPEFGNAKFATDLAASASPNRWGPIDVEPVWLWLESAAAALPSLAHALEIAALAADTGQPPLQVAERYFALRRRFGLPVLTTGLAALPRRTTWEARAAQVLGAGFDELLRNSVQRALGGAQTALVARSETLEMLLGELERGERADLAGLLVAAGEIERLI